MFRIALSGAAAIFFAVATTRSDAQTASRHEQSDAARLYRSTPHRFSISYPAAWKQAPPKTGVVVVKVVDPHSERSCTVSVHRADALKNMKTAEVMRKMTPAYFTESLSDAGFVNVKAHEGGLTYLSNREAFYTVVNFALRTMSGDFQTTALLAVTTRNDTVFTLSCGTEPNDFSQARGLFSAIFGTFVAEP